MVTPARRITMDGSGQIVRLSALRHHASHRRRRRHRDVRASSSCDDPELGDRGATRTGRRLVGALDAHRVGGGSAADVPAAARARAGDERLLLRRALRADEHLLLLALPHQPRRVQPLPQRLPGRHVHRARHSLVVPDRSAAACQRRAEDTLRSLSNIDIGSPTSSSFSNPVAAVPSLHAGWALGVGIGLVIYARPLFWKLVGVFYPIAVVLTIVVTGNHFVFDALAGMLVMGSASGSRNGSGAGRDPRRSPPRAAPDSGVFAARSAGLDGVTVLQSSPRRGVEQSGSSPGS